MKPNRMLLRAAFCAMMGCAALTPLSGCRQDTAPPPPAGPADLPALPPDPRQGGNNGSANGPAIGGMSSKPVGVAALPAQPIDGSKLNRFFPSGVTFTQEKKGTVVAEIKPGVTLTIADLAANPSARDKYKSSSMSISGYPAVAVGANGTAILVGDRYQVQARSTGAAFPDTERASWLAKVKLAELEGLK